MFKKSLKAESILRAAAAVIFMTTTWNIAIAQEGSSTTLQTIESKALGQDLVLDANDFPVLAYQHVSTGGLGSLKIARCTDVDCAGVLVQRLARLGSGLRVDISTAGSITVMIDSNDRPVVGYTQDNQLHIARCLDRLCKRVSQQNIGSGQSAAFALDLNDYIVASYATETGEDDSPSWAIDLTRCSNKQCGAVTTNRIETIEQSSPPRVALAIDSNNNPVLSYVTNSSRFEFENAAIIARCIDSACNDVNKTTIIDAGYLDAPVMVLDHSDNPVVTVVEYKGLIEDLTHYVACLDADCLTQQEQQLTTRWEHNLTVDPRSLAIADDGSVTFVVVGESDGELWPELFRCATFSCNAIEYRGLISGTPVRGGRPALAVDQAGEPVVAFVGEQSLIAGGPNLRNLKVARCGSEPCLNAQEVYGKYHLQSALTNEYLSLDAGGIVGSSPAPGVNEIWDVDVNQYGRASIRNVEFNQYLDLPQQYFAPRVTPDRKNQWLPIRPDVNGLAIVREHSLAMVVQETDFGIVGVRNPWRLDTEEPQNLWRIISTNPVAPNELVGTRIAFRNTVTGRWLDNDPNGAVNQSVNQSADDIWLVQDAGDGYVFLVNEFTGLYINADRHKLNLDSSSTLTSDNRWELRMTENRLTIRSVSYDGYVAAQGSKNAFNSIRQSGLSATAYWIPRIIQ